MEPVKSVTKSDEYRKSKIEKAKTWHSAEHEDERWNALIASHAESLVNYSIALTDLTKRFNRLTKVLIVIVAVCVGLLIFSIFHNPQSVVTITTR